jgi:NAD(P)-dependent dehydrogenase (short-subunit alcohol dehydrogenase family)
MVTKQVVLVTGASTGFGRLIGETLARHGHTVFATMRDLAGRNASNTSAIRDLAKKETLPLHVLETDVTDEASAERAVRDCVKQAGRIDVVINNAGYVVMGLAECVTLAQARRLMDTNFFGSVIVNRAVLPYMRRQRSGLLLHVSSDRRPPGDSGFRVLLRQQVCFGSTRGNLSLRARGAGNRIDCRSARPLPDGGFQQPGAGGRHVTLRYLRHRQPVCF